MNQLTQQKQSRWLFYTLLFVLMGLCFVRYTLQVNIPLPVLLIPALLISILGDRDEIIAMCICCIPLETSLQYSYVLLCCIVMYFIKYSHTVRFNLSVVPILLMVLWELLHCFSGLFSPARFIVDVLPLLLLVILMCTEDGSFDYDFIVRAFSVCVLSMCIGLLGKLFYLNGFDIWTVLNGLQRLGLDAEETRGKLAITGGEQNPNTLSILCVLAVTGLIQLRRAGRSRIGDLGLMLSLLLFGALTTSRTYLACLAVMVVLFLLSQRGSMRKKLKLLGSIVLILLVVLLLLYLLFPSLLDYYYSRFLVEDITTGRMKLIQIYHKFIVSDPEILFFGIGLHNFEEELLQTYRVSTLVPHNGIQELIIAWGIPGLMFFVLLWVVMLLRSCQSNRKFALVCLIPLFILLVKVQAGQMLTSIYTMLAFSYAYLSMCSDLLPKDN